MFGHLGSEESGLERARQRLVFSVSELRTRLLEQFTAGVALLNEAIATRVDRKPDDFAVQIWSGAVVGVALAVCFAARQYDGELVDALDRGLALLGHGGLALLGEGLPL